MTQDADTLPLDTESKAPGAFKTISEVAEFLDVPPHVLRFWESKFPQIKPLKMRGGRRYYRPEDVATLVGVKDLLYKEGYTIEGARKAFLHPKPDMTPAVSEAQTPKEKPTLTDKQRAQLTVLREQLITMRDTLKSRIA